MTAMDDVAGTAVVRSTPPRTAALRRWAWVPVLAVGSVLYELVRETLQVTGDPLFVPTLILLGAAVVPVAFVAFISGLRLSFGVGAWTVGLTALVGGTVGVLIAGSLEFQTLRRDGRLPFLDVGLIEELAKLLVPVMVLLVLRRRLRPADGLLVGVAAGAGFAVLETMGYGLVALVGSRGDLTVVNDLLVERALLSPAAHMAWTGLAAAALWNAAASGWRVRAVIRAVLTFLFVAGLHAAWDSSSSRWTHAALALVSFSLLVWTAHRLAGTERARRASMPVFPLAAARSGWRPGEG